MLLGTLKRFLWFAWLPVHSFYNVSWRQGWDIKHTTYKRIFLSICHMPQTEAETQLCISLSFPQKSMIKKRIDINFLLLLC